ncbi:MAG: DUF2188 domain-containing protein [Patescibacteria group bacterium]|jgi:hypothetical protein
MTTYHILPDPDKGWAIKKEGGRRKIFAPTQKSAEKIARRSATSGRFEIVIHRRDGRIRDMDTIHPTSDPFPPKRSRR